MNIEERINILEKCFQKFNEGYDERNFCITTLENNIIKFNFRQSKLATLLGISEKYLEDVDISREHDFLALRNLIENREYFIEKYYLKELNSGRIFAPSFDRRTTVFLEMGELNTFNAKFIIYPKEGCIYDCYIFVKDKKSEQGYLVALSKKNNYYNPKDFLKISTIKDIKTIINIEKIELISAMAKYNKKNEKTNNTKNRLFDLNEMCLLLKENGIDLGLNKEELNQKLLITQNDYTAWVDPKKYGFEGKTLRMNISALDIFNHLYEELKNSKKTNEELIIELNILKEKLSKLEEETSKPKSQILSKIQKKQIF